ncbi:LysR family transcriptional regulator [Paracoccus sp. Z330]|uniref:LysR family transcriptional regulator n=1 Tax=Paracoccus onchidii TaxID=3017813 RepID=A0ABT4ZIA0_9RHOB|nr:LysR family transcriptional regulator [Paracoccus onchidii]MDB6179084.1 LysR family transcriptional regulator [Paracoccus onchidii]
MSRTGSTSENQMATQGKLSLRSLRVFVAVEETGSVAGAAKKLGISKSNVSQQVTAMETGIGSKLFDRTQKPISLTPVGQALALHAHRILTTVSIAEASLAELNLGSLPLLNFAIIDDLDASLTPSLAASMQARLPRCFIRTFSGRSDQVTARLLSRDADIAVTAIIPADMHKFQVLQLLREKFVLVTARGAYSNNLDWRSQLETLPFIQYSDAMPMGRMVSAHLKRLSVQFPRRFSFEASRSVIATVAKTGGWTLTTPLSLLDSIRFRESIDIWPLPFAGLSRQIYLIHRLEELGSMPDSLAQQCRTLLRQDALSEFSRLAPHLTDAIEIYNETLI